MIKEQFGCGCMADVPADPEAHGCGRIMSDVSSSFVIYNLEMLKWGNYTELAK